MSDDESIIEASYVPALLPNPATARTRRQVPNRRGKGGFEAFPPHVEHVYFTVWYLRHRPGPKELLQLAAEDWDMHAPEGEPFAAVSIATLKRWIAQHEWVRKANEHTLGQAPERYLAFQTATFEVGENGVAFLRDFLTGKLDDENRQNPIAMRNKVDAAKFAVQAAGGGTFGTRDRTAPKLRQAIARVVDAYVLDEQELNRHRREALHAGRTDHEERKR